MDRQSNHTIMMIPLNTKKFKFNTLLFSSSYTIYYTFEHLQNILFLQVNIIYSVLIEKFRLNVQ